MIDSHAHVMVDAFDADRDAVFERSRQTGVVGWIEVGTDLEQSRKAIALAQHHENVWATVGVHPSDIPELTEDVWRVIEQLLREPRVIAVGEVGFDLYRGGLLDQQRVALQRFVGLAQQWNLPIVFHVRSPAKSRLPLDRGASGTFIDAHEEMITFLSSYSDQDRPRGVMHTFSGTREQAARYLGLGMYLSFSGVVTFRNAGETAEVAKTVPLDRMLIETDCPFLAPEPYRGKRNEPAYVKFVAEKIAGLRGVTVNVVAEATEHNARELFLL